MILAPLTGTWTGPGEGLRPRPFTYTETLTFTELPGKPVLRYEQTTVAPHGQPMHTEVGFIRVSGEQVELILADVTGIASILEGTVELSDETLTLILNDPATRSSSTAKNVTAQRRTLVLDLHARTLETRSAHATEGGDLVEHLRSELHR